jgi:branched-chain amino acid transport system ATP-binding protein
VRASSNLLEVEQVSKSFGGLMALNAVSLQVTSGEMLGLIGPNGSGKSTLFNVITGYLKPDKGRVCLQGSKITAQRPDQICKAGVGRTFQLVRPFMHLTGLENVLAARLYGRQPAGSQSQAKAQAHELLHSVGLANQADTPAHSMTLMDRKRLELARALAARPLLLLLDELLTGLNPKEMSQAMDLLKVINAQGLTLVVVEHIVRAVMELCPRIVVLNLGSVIAEGGPQQISNHPEVINAYLGREHARSRTA